MYNKLFFSVIGAIALFTLVLPYLISAKSTELTILGFLIIILVLYKIGQLIVQLHKGDE